MEMMLYREHDTQKETWRYRGIRGIGSRAVSQVKPILLFLIKISIILI
jgi:hypothetical protein